MDLNASCEENGVAIVAIGADADPALDPTLDSALDEQKQEPAPCDGSSIDCGVVVTSDTDAVDVAEVVAEFDTTAAETGTDDDDDDDVVALVASNGHVETADELDGEAAPTGALEEVTAPNESDLFANNADFTADSCCAVSVERTESVINEVTCHVEAGDDVIKSELCTVTNVGATAVIEDVASTPFIDDVAAPDTDSAATTLSDVVTTPDDDVATTLDTAVATTPDADIATTLDTAVATTPDADVATTLDTAVATTPDADVVKTTHADVFATPVTDVAATSVTDVATTPVAATPVIDDDTTPVIDVATTPVADVATAPVTDVDTTPVIDVATTPVTDVATTPAGQLTAVGEPSPECAIIEAGLKKILFSPPGTLVNGDDAANAKKLMAAGSKTKTTKNRTRSAEKKKTKTPSTPTAQKIPAVENGGSSAKKMKTSHEIESIKNKNQFQKMAPLDRTNPSEEKVRAMMKEDVHPLRKRNNKFPQAAYVCRLCSYHCDNMDVCERHVRDGKHKQFKENREIDLLLRNLPPLTPAHVQALDAFLDRCSETYALPECVVGHRQSLVKKLEALVQESLPDVTLKLYGSSANGFGLKSSDVNIDMILPAGRSASQTLTAVLKVLQDKSNYVKVTSDFEAKIPYIGFTDPISDVNVHLSLGNYLARHTTQLLAAYCQIDPRVQKVGVAFRFFAKVCKIDQQVLGTLPAHAFSLMTIYFLQRTQPPVLPVLHELRGEGRSQESILVDGKELSWFYDDISRLNEVWPGVGLNKASGGELWIQLFRYYCTTFELNRHVVCIRQKSTLNRDDKKWSHKKLAIEDPFATRLNLSRCVSHSRNLDFIHDCLKSAYKYYGIPQTKSGPAFRRVNLRAQKPAQDKPTTTETLVSPKVMVRHDTEPLTALESRTLKEIAHGVVDMAVESVRQELEKSCTASAIKDVKGDVYDNVEHYVIHQQEENATHSVNELEKTAESVLLASFTGAFHEILDAKANHSFEESVQHDEYHDAVPNHVSAAHESESSSEGGDHMQKQFKKVENIEEFAEKYVDFILDTATQSVDSAKKRESTPEDDVLGKPVPARVIRLLKRDTSEEHYGDDEGDDEDITDLMDAHVDGDDLVVESGADLVLEESAIPREGDYNKNLVEALKKTDILFTFDSMKLTEGKKPSIVCSVCQAEGHLKNECPDSVLPAVVPLKPLTNEYKKFLNKTLCSVPDHFMPTEKEVTERKDILTELESFLRELYKDCNLCMFGSSCNQFGFKKSDLDICMTFDKVNSPKEIDCIDIIEKVAVKLKSHKGVYGVNAITTAKVPIVKFRHRKAQIEADISLYNTLALHNTKMLERYASIDSRVRTLGYIMKAFAKVCDIGDASRGSLSSYAYILMVLHYLQQCEPPVVPCLQEIHDGERPSTIIDGCDAWFFDDLEALPEKWPGYKKNNQSVAELWLGLLFFYVERFNFREHVITIRQLKPLTRFEKLWNGRTIAIEDPFDLAHNLGAGLSRKMNTFIMKAFINARQRFGTAVDLDGLPRGLYEYLFDTAALADGQPPTDRGCRACGKIGHIARECPIVLNKKDIRDARDRGDRGGAGANMKRQADSRRDQQIRPLQGDDRRRRGPMPSPQMPMRGGPGVGQADRSPYQRPGLGPFPPRGPHVYYNSGMPRAPVRFAFDGRGMAPGPPARGMGPRSPHSMAYGRQQMVMDPRHALPHMRPTPDRFPSPGNHQHHLQSPGQLPPQQQQQQLGRAALSGAGPGAPAALVHQSGANKYPGSYRDGAGASGQRSGGTAVDVDKAKEAEKSAPKGDEAKRHELDAQEKLNRGIRAKTGKTAVVLGKQDSRLDPNYDELCKKVVEDRAAQLRIHQQHVEEMEKQKQQQEHSPGLASGAVVNEFSGQKSAPFHQTARDREHWAGADHHQQRHQPTQGAQQQQAPSRGGYGANYAGAGDRRNFQARNTNETGFGIQKTLFSPNAPRQEISTNFNNSNRDTSQMKDFKNQSPIQILSKPPDHKTKPVTPILQQTFSSSSQYSTEASGMDTNASTTVTQQKPVGAQFEPRWKKTHGPMLLQRPAGVTSGELALPVDLGLNKLDGIKLEKAQTEQVQQQQQQQQPIPPFQIDLNQRMLFSKEGSLVNQMQLPMNQFRSPNRPSNSTSPLALLNQSISPTKRYQQQQQQQQQPPSTDDLYRRRRSPSKDQPPRFQNKSAVRQLDQSFSPDVGVGLQPAQNDTSASPNPLFQPTQLVPNQQLHQNLVHMQPTYLFYPQHNYQTRPEQKDDLFSNHRSESMFNPHVMNQSLSSFQGHAIFPPQQQQVGFDGLQRGLDTSELSSEHKFDYQFQDAQFNAPRDVYQTATHPVYYNQSPLQNQLPTQQDASSFYQTAGAPAQSQSAALTGTQIWFTSVAQPTFPSDDAVNSSGVFAYGGPSPTRGAQAGSSVSAPSMDRSNLTTGRNDPWNGGTGSVNSYQPSTEHWSQQSSVVGQQQHRFDQQFTFPLGTNDVSQSHLFGTLDDSQNS